MGVLINERRCRRLFVWIVALIIIVLAFGGIVFMKGSAENSKFIF
jgi:hypothetical protein